MARPSEAGAALGPSPGRWAQIAPALRSRNFRLFWVGQIVSVVGTFLQTVAENWLIYDLTGSTFMLGVIGFIGLVPVIPISFLGGVIVDRVPRRKLIMATQIGLLAQAAVFGLLAIGGWITVWHIIALDFVMGALFAVDQPARQAFLIEIVPEDDLPNAIALNSAIFQLSRVVGQAAAGVLIATMGAGGAMLLNAATYLAPIVALTLIRVKDVAYDAVRQPLGTAMSEGIVTLWKQPALLGTVSLMVTVGGLPLALSLMMPAFAEEVLGAGAIGLGLLLASVAVGSVVSTLLVARVRSGWRGMTLLVSSLILPPFLVGFGLSRDLTVACILLVATGVLQSILHAMSTTLVQINVPNRVRGRVMSLYGMLIIGVPKVAAVLIGGVAEYVGLPMTIGLFSAVALVFALGLHVLVPSVRRLD